MSDLLTVLDPSDQWRVRRFGRLVDRVQEVGRPDLQPLSVFLDQGVVPRSTQDDNYNRLGADLSKYLVVRPGDIVFNKLRTWQGGLGVSKYEGIVSPAYYVCRPRQGIEPRFLHYLLRSVTYLQELTRISKWMPPSQFDIGWEDLRLLPTLLPTQRLQRTIADFLDAETTRIDALIAKKRQLRQLLGARLATLARKLIFTQTNARTVRLGRVVSILPGYAFSSSDFLTDEQDAIRLLRGINVAPGRCRWEEVVYLPKSQMHQHQAYLLSVGDLVIGMDRPFISDGTRLATIKETDVPALLVQRVARIRTKEALNPMYLSFALHSDVFTDHCTPIATGVSVPHISGNHIADFRVPLPDRKVQERVADRLVAEEKRINTLRDQISRQVELLAEHRQALITAAVTGQLRMPGVAA